MAYSLILLLTILYSSALHGSRPIISILADGLGASPEIVGLLFSVYALLPMLLAVVIGRYIDRVSARLFILVGLTGIAVALALPAVSATVSTLFVSQALSGASQIAVILSLQKVLGNLGGSRDQTIATYTFAVSLGGFVGPLALGISYDSFGSFVTFILGASLCLAAVVVAVIVAPEVWRKGVGKPTGGAFSTSVSMLRRSELRTAFWVSGLAVSSRDTFVAFFPLYATELGLGAAATGFVIAMMGAAGTVVRLVQYRLVLTWGRSLVLTLAFVIAGAALVAFAFTTLTPLMLLLSVFIGAGLGLGQPLSLVSVLELTPPEDHGSALGLRLTFNRASQFTAPALFGLVGGLAGVAPVFWINGALLIAAARAGGRIAEGGRKVGRAT